MIPWKLSPPPLDPLRPNPNIHLIPIQRHSGRPQPPKKKRTKKCELADTGVKVGFTVVRSYAVLGEHAGVQTSQRNKLGALAWKLPPLPWKPAKTSTEASTNEASMEVVEAPMEVAEAPVEVKLCKFAYTTGPRGFPHYVFFPRGGPWKLPLLPWKKVMLLFPKKLPQFLRKLPSKSKAPSFTSTTSMEASVGVRTKSMEAANNRMELLPCKFPLTSSGTRDVVKVCGSFF